MSSQTKFLMQQFERILLQCDAGESRLDVFRATLESMSDQDSAEFLTQEAKRLRNFIISSRDTIKGNLDYQIWLKSKGRSNDVLSQEMALHHIDGQLQGINVFIQSCMENQIEADGFERAEQDNVVFLFDHPLAAEKAKKQLEG